MKRFTLVLTLCLTLCFPSYARIKPSTQSTPPEPSNQTPKAPLAFSLEDGTPVKLRINRTISSADAKTDETVDFEVLEDVKFGEITLIPCGGIAVRLQQTGYCWRIPQTKNLCVLSDRI